MKMLQAAVAAFLLCVSGIANAGLITFTQSFSDGFNVSINGGAQMQSGAVTITAQVDENETGVGGVFAIKNVYFSGAGFVKQLVTTPLELLIWTKNKFAFQLKGKFNTGITGWNGSTFSGDFITNVNDLTTITSLPYSTTGTSTFWLAALNSNAWALASGDTIGGNIGANGPNGTFSISRNVVDVPDVSAPATLALIGFAFIGLTFRRLKK
jgi:hypothetical protein